jgi:hypothetical protein
MPTSPYPRGAESVTVSQIMKPRAMLEAALGYVRKNPDIVVRTAINAASLRFGVPIAALRWFAAQLPEGRKAPKDIEIGSSPPALRVSATIDAMGTNIRASAAIKIDEISVSTDSIRVGLRLRDVKLDLLGDSDAPVATLIKSGVLDLSKPGNVVKVIPKKPDAIVDAYDDRIVVDLMKIPKIANNARLRRIIETMTPLINIGSIETDRDHVYVRLKATPQGLPQTIEALLKRA